MIKLEKDEEGEFPSDKNSANNFKSENIPGKNIFKTSRTLEKFTLDICALLTLSLNYII